MSSKNNDDLGTAAAFVIAGVGLLALLFFAVFAFLALVFTVLALMAWNKPLRIGSIVITPEEARGFVGRGLVGMALLPTFWAFCCLLFGLPFLWEYLGYLLVGGYTLGSIGFEILIAEDEPAAVHPAQAPTPALPAPAERRTIEAEPFRFASWDDEEKSS